MNDLVKYSKNSRLLTIEEVRAIIAQRAGKTSYVESEF